MLIQEHCIKENVSKRKLFKKKTCLEKKLFTKEKFY